MRRHILPELPEGWFVCICFLLGVLGLIFASMPASAEATKDTTPRPGAVCIVADGWWSLDPERPQQPEPVRVKGMHAAPWSAEPAAWVQPMRGPLTGHQYLIAVSRLQGCRT